MKSFLSFFLVFCSMFSFSQADSSDQTSFDPIFGTDDRWAISKDSLLNMAIPDDNLIGVWKLKLRKNPLPEGYTDVIYDKVYMVFTEDRKLNLYNDTSVNTLFWGIVSDTLHFYYESLNDSAQLSSSEFFVPIVLLNSRTLTLTWPDVFYKMANETWVLRRRRRYPVQ